MSTELDIVQNGSELCGLILNKVLDGDAMQSAILDIYGDVKAAEAVIPDNDGFKGMIVGIVIKRLEEEIEKLFLTFGTMAGYDEGEIYSAIDVWYETKRQFLPAIVESTLMLNGKEFRNRRMLLDERMQTIRDEQYRIFPQFRSSAHKSCTW